MRELRVMYEHTPPWEVAVGMLPPMATILRGVAMLPDISLPPGCHLHAPSWQPRHAAALATEVEIHHLPIDPVRWPAGGPVWGRERFCRRRDAAGLVAYSTDAHGRVVRGWFSTPDDAAVYANGGTCPIEAVALAHLQPGVPAIPAHLLIGAQRGWPGYAKALAKMW